MKDLLKFLDRIPPEYAYLRKGPWTLEAKLTVTLYGAYLLYSSWNMETLWSQFHPDVGSNKMLLLLESVGVSLQAFRLVIGVYMLLFAAGFIYQTGPWPLCTYTMTSWNILTLRFLTAFIAGTEYSPSWLRTVSAVLRYPALVMNTITGKCSPECCWRSNQLNPYLMCTFLPPFSSRFTLFAVTVWWTLIVPVILHLLHDEEKKKNFRKFNSSFGLVNIHAINLPIALVEFLASGVQLTYQDLHVAFLIGYLYVLFYLNFLDAKGIQLYLIFTPRTRWCVVTFSLLPVLYVAFFKSYNYLLEVL
jgi:hypothetical protein